MLRRLVILFALAVLGTSCAHASLRETMSTAQLLNGTVDSCIVKLDVPTANTNRDIYGVALNFDGVLWLYVPGLGTRTLGPAPATGAWQTAIPELLQKRSSDLHALKVYPRQVALDRGDLSQSLTNGCFAGCLLRLSRFLVEGEPIAQAGVLFLSESPTTSSPTAPLVFDEIGHTMLLFRARDEWRIYDPGNAGQVLAFPDFDFRVGEAVDARLLTYARTRGYPTRAVRFYAFSPRSLQELVQRAARADR